MLKIKNKLSQIYRIYEFGKWLLEKPIPSNNDTRLTIIIDYLDFADDAFEILGKLPGNTEYVKDDLIQRDLRWWIERIK